jgi:hypothetical protein
MLCSSVLERKYRETGLLHLARYQGRREPWQNERLEISTMGDSFRNHSA